MKAHADRSHPCRWLFRALLVVALAAVAPGSAVAAAAGSFLFVGGEVRVTPAAGGNAVRVHKGAQVDAGDTVVTGPRGVAQLRMVDGALLALRPATELRIDAYSFEQPQAEDRSFFSLLSGAFRSITGLIGQRNTDGYRVTTSTATIGIRGSDADIGHDASTSLTAVRTYTGGHTVTANDQSGPRATLNTGPGDIALVRPGAPPAFGTEFPFSTTPPPDDGAEGGDGGGAESGDEGDAGEDAVAEEVADADGSDDAAPSLAPPPAPVVRLVTASEETAVDVLVPASLGSGVIGAEIFVGPAGLEAGAGTLFVDGRDSQVVLLGASNELRFAAGNVSAEPFLFSSDGGVLVGVGRGAVSGSGGGVAATVNWGLWQGDYTVVDGGVERMDNIGGFAFAVASRVTRPLEIAALGGTAFSYSSFGGIAVNEKGALPSSLVVTASGAFNGSSTLGSISVLQTASFPVGSTGWSIAGSGTIAAFLHNSVPTSGTCSSCSTAVGETGGLFIGPRAEGMIISIGAADASTGHAMSGVAALRR